MEERYLARGFTMGCDIHWCLEVKHEGKWIGLMANSYNSFPAGDRWYAFFAELAGVRGETPSSEPRRGYPDDMSDLAKYSRDKDCWVHSESWLPLDGFVAAFKRAHERYPSAESEKALRCLFGEDFADLQDENAEYRVVFAFDS